MSVVDSIMNKTIPSSDSPNWPLFVLFLIVMLLVGPKTLDAWRRYKYSLKPGIERRSEPSCAAHSAEIASLKAKVNSQGEELIELRREFLRQVSELREFIDDHLSESREMAQQDRLALGVQISTQISDLIRLLPHLGKASS